MSDFFGLGGNDSHKCRRRASQSSLKPRSLKRSSRASARRRSMSVVTPRPLLEDYDPIGIGAFCVTRYAPNGRCLRKGLGIDYNGYGTEGSRNTTIYDHVLQKYFARINLPYLEGDERAWFQEAV